MRTGTGLTGLGAPVFLFAMLCGVIGLLLSTSGPAASRDSPSSLESGDAITQREAIERALEHLDRAATALSGQYYDDSKVFIEQAQEVLRRANNTESSPQGTRR